MTTLRVLLHVAAQRDYELHSLDFSTAFLQGSVHEEIWLRRPPGFSGSFPDGTQWSLRRPVCGLRQAPREWHDTLRTTLASLGFAPSTADPSLFLRTDTTLPPFYVLVYVDDLVFATADTEALAHVKSELQKRHTCIDLGELTSYLGLQITRDRAQRTITLTQSHMVQQVLQRFSFTYSSPQSTPLPTAHSLSAPPSDESVEPSGPYPELVGCLMYLMTCTRPDLAYPLSLLARYVAPGKHRKVHWDAAKRMLRYLCSTSGMGLMLGGRARVVLTGHADASWVDDLATQRSSQGYTFSLGSGSVSWRSSRSSSVLSSSYEAEIYAGAMAAQELRWLTYLLTDLGEAPRSPPVLYVDNKALLALCQEHRTKHIALRYFLARELQQRGQLCLAYMASQANTADVFTKALQPCDHQRTVLLYLLDWSCDPLFSPTLPMGPEPRCPAPTELHCPTAACAATAGTTAVTALASALLPTYSTDLHSHFNSRYYCPFAAATDCHFCQIMATITVVAAAKGGQQQPLPLPDTLSLQQLCEWVIQRAGPGGGGFGFLRTAQRQQQTQQKTFSPQLLSELFSQRCVPGSEEAATLGASEFVAALGASESAAASGARESAAALGARASTAKVPASAKALHTFTLDTSASRCFFRDSTTLTPLSALVLVSMADLIGGPVVARASTVLPCLAVPSGSLLGLHLPKFSTNLLSNAVLKDAPGSGLYTLTTASAHVAESGQVAALSQVSASGQLAASCSCRILPHQTLLWHHRLGHPSLPRLRIMHSRLLVSGLPRSLPSLSRLPAPRCLPCVEGRQRAAPHSSEFPPTTAPLQTLHMDVWSLAPVVGMDQERYFLLVVDDYTRYTTVFPLQRKADVSGVLIPWVRATCRQLREQFSRDFPVLRQYSDRGGEFSSDLLAKFCRDEGVV
ncbi:unnamed protein product [Closterium sp. NIES-53]